ncbi:MAG: S26 family signal peptidase [Bacteroidetes bacterium]|nr:S26 family signal peptidase [Bacteroidota bacterium]
MEILIFLIITYILFSITMMKLFEKAGVDGKKALIPGLNFVEMCKIVGRKPSHALWLLFPIVNIFIFVGLCVDMVRSFGRYSFGSSAMAVIFAPAIFYVIGKDKNDKYLGPNFTMEREYKNKIIEAQKAGDKRELQKLNTKNPYAKSPAREWTEAIVFAVFAASFIRMFLIEAYVIPTSSMEGSLKVGDFLFVSKAHYGIRTPKTVLMFPLLHNRLPFFDCESYISKPNLPFYRLPAISEVKRYDPVVFNYPEGDSVYVFPERTWSINDYRRGASGDPQQQQRFMQIKTGNADLVVRPIDKRDHYIKRCIGLPGDSLKIVDRQVYINGTAAQNPTHMQFLYVVESPSGPLNKEKLDEMGVNTQESYMDQGIYWLDKEQVEKIKAMDPAIKIDFYPFEKLGKHDYFPHDPVHYGAWTNDNYGPIYIPKKGATVAINPESIAFYERIISNYEGNKLEKKDGKFFINGQEATSYTFKMNYYWMMGDNRHNSEDSRVWGFVPENHIVGKPLFIWFSTKNGSIRNGINWNRIFTGANKM